MIETDYNRILVKSLLLSAPDGGIIAKKNHGSMYSASWPDIDGSYMGYSFFIEGKMGKTPANPASRVLNIKQFQEKQIANIKKIIAAHTPTFAAIYVTDVKDKYLFLFPINANADVFFNDGITLDYVSNNTQWVANYTKRVFEPQRVLHIVKRGIHDTIMIKRRSQ